MRFLCGLPYATLSFKVSFNIQINPAKWVLILFPCLENECTETWRGKGTCPGHKPIKLQSHGPRPCPSDQPQGFSLISYIVSIPFIHQDLFFYDVTSLHFGEQACL